MKQKVKSIGRSALITGGAGFIGSHLAERLIKEGMDVTVLDNLFTGRLENLSSIQKKRGFRFIHGDVREQRIVTEATKDIDVLFHHAALTSVSASLEDPLSVEEVNVIGTLNLLEAARKADVDRIILASSAAIYGHAVKLPCTERDPPSPVSPYGVTKVAIEDYCRVLCEIYGFKSAALRYFNVYGPRQRADLEGGVIAIFTSRLLKDQRPIIYGDGQNTRDFIHVHDVIEANLRALEMKTGFDVFNIGTGVPTSILTLAKILSHLIGKEDLTPIYTRPREGDIKNSWCDTVNATKGLDFSASLSLEEGLRRTLDVYTVDK